MTTETVKQRAERVLSLAQELERQGKSWKQANDALFSPSGLATVLFPTASERKKLVQSPTYKKVTKIMESLNREEEDEECNGRLLVRVPKSLHRSLKKEAEAEGVSLNQLVLAKLASDYRAMVGG